MEPFHPLQWLLIIVIAIAIKGTPYLVALWIARQARRTIETRRKP